MEHVGPGSTYDAQPGMPVERINTGRLQSMRLMSDGPNAAVLSSALRRPGISCSMAKDGWVMLQPVCCRRSSVGSVRAREALASRTDGTTAVPCTIFRACDGHTRGG
jgi:hypothetical protein